jgi:hypothetical protein
MLEQLRTGKKCLTVDLKCIGCKSGKKFKKLLRSWQKKTKGKSKCNYSGSLYKATIFPLFEEKLDIN